MSGHAVTKITQYEVVAAWTVPQSVITAVAAAPGWVTIGEYYLPKTVELSRLDMVGLVSAPGLTLTVRLWDVTAAGPVNGSVSTGSTSPVRVLGAAVLLHGARTYQVQVQCVGAVGDDKFGVVGSATISD